MIIMNLFLHIYNFIRFDAKLTIEAFTNHINPDEPCIDAIQQAGGVC